MPLTLRFLIATVAVLAGLAVASPAAAPPTPSNHGITHRLTSYNVCATHCNYLAPWTTRAPTIIKQIAKSTPDAFVIQEAGGTHESELLIRLASRHGYRTPARSDARLIFFNPDVLAVIDSGLSRRHIAGQDADFERWRIHDYLDGHGYSHLAGGNTLVQHPNDSRNLGGCSTSTGLMCGASTSQGSR